MVSIIFYFLNSMLAEKLNMTPEEAERWIVNLIRNAKLDAKIDSKLVIKLCLLWKKKNTTKEIIISIGFIFEWMLPWTMLLFSQNSEVI